MEFSWKLIAFTYYICETGKNPIKSYIYKSGSKRIYMAEKQKGPENEKLVAALSYIIVGMIWYAVDEEMKKSELAKYHVKQALNLLIISVGVNIIMGILGFLGMLLTIILAMLGPMGMIVGVVGWIIFTVIGVALFILWLIGLIYAINGQKKPVPLVGKLADKYLKF